MALEDRIRTALDQAFADLRTRLETDARSVADQLAAAAAEERQTTLTEARNAALQEAAQETERRVAEAEARLRSSLDLEAEQKIGEALATAEQRMKVALTEAETRAEQAMKDSVAAARVRERDHEMATVTRLLDSIRGLDGATTLSEVLDALGQAAGKEAGRAAVLVLRNERLLGWKLTGFGARDAQPKTIDLGLNECGVIGLAVGAARPVTTRDSDAGGPGFAELPADRMGFAVPVIVGGRVVSVVYADSHSESGDHVVPSGWPEAIEILARHAARVLEALTVQKSANTPTPKFWVPPGTKPGSGAPQSAPTQKPPDAPQQAMSIVDLPEESARRLARLLLSEIKMYHEPAVDEGRRSRNLLSRLAPEIERARRAYDARIPVTLQTRAELFQQELIATLAGGDPSLLGAPA